jgi:hypothetical protein
MPFGQNYDNECQGRSDHTTDEGDQKVKQILEKVFIQYRYDRHGDQHVHQYKNQYADRRREEIFQSRR